MEYKKILGIVPGLQATSLVVANIPKKFPMKPSGNMKLKPVLRRGITNLVGVPLIKATSESINKL